MLTMNTTVWQESGANLLRETLRQEARKWHQAHQPPVTLAAWKTQREHVLAALHKAAGTVPDAVPLDVCVHGELRQDGYRIRKLTYQSRPGFRVTANLYLPDGKGPFPGVLGVHGHWSQGKIAARVAARGHLLAKSGFVALLVDAFGSGERGTKPGEFEYHGGKLGISLLSLGETLLGMQVVDNMRGIDLLQSLDVVNPDRIGVTGASGGGNQTMWVAALDPRVKAAVPVVSVGTFESYVTNCNCVCEVLPGGLPIAEEWAILGLCAPNALLILNSLLDGPTFVAQEMIRSFNAAREVYRLHGCIDKIAYQAIQLPHGYWPEMQRYMLGWFKLWLKDEGNGLPCETPAIPELPERDLMCFPDGKRPADVPSIVEYLAAQSPSLRKRALAPAVKLERKTELTALRELLKVRDNGRCVRRGPAVVGETQGVTFRKFSVETEPGVLLPCVLLEPKGARGSTTVLALHPQGKDAAAKTQTVETLLSEGKRVCLVDLRNQGETRWDTSTIHPDHDAARAALWLGHTMLGDTVQDILAVKDALADGRRGQLFELLAWGEPGLAALAAAAALTTEFAKVTVSGLLSTYVVTDSVPLQGMSIAVPGILHWGDVGLLAALVPCPVAVFAPVSPAGKALTKPELAAWQKEARALAKRLGTPGQIETRPDVLA
ncbi:MAG: hypothetical protein A3K19_27695 [Lentisphaerae bacterium RIFOXYB12_FULL_65_16]|nr:MAG: hypothetical protein A3K18_20710 [Lentisphaerae bacterium RIFOXYA12_64_32]OGV84184.1 MAG: hypothetical protein A3K19_27695 [Lentisphaerae bacterium RIFOXYB12_FULL_65_16]